MFDILIVDDDKNTRYLMETVLKSEGYNAYSATNGKDALAILDDTHVDLIILDIMMPEMDGYEFTEAVRSVNYDMPILMVSAKQLAEDRKKGFMLGIDDFMTKPVDTEEMLLRIRALLRRAKIASDKKIVIGSVVIDYNSFSVIKDGVSQELPQKEFMLLFKLLSFPDKIFTRIQLMDEIWGMDCETGWETLTVHINRLRKRFDGWQEFSIKSVKGLGYKAVKNL